MNNTQQNIILKASFKNVLNKKILLNVNLYAMTTSYKMLYQKEKTTHKLRSSTHSQPATGHVSPSQERV